MGETGDSWGVALDPRRGLEARRGTGRFDAPVRWSVLTDIAVDGGLSGIKLPPAAGYHMRNMSR
jgi:hypothetical protein